MKQKFIFWIVMIIVVASICTAIAYCFIGCEGHMISNTQSIENRMYREYGRIDASHEIIVDKETGVMYLCIYRGGVCVMVDKDGEPLISKDFG